MNQFTDLAAGILIRYTSNSKTNAVSFSNNNVGVYLGTQFITENIVHLSTRRFEFRPNIFSSSFYTLTQCTDGTKTS